jgi:hypothetical protein
MTPNAHTSRDAQMILGDGWPRGIGSVVPEVNTNEVLRYLGYPAGVRPRGPLAEQLEDTIGQAARWSRPRAIYAVFPVEAIDRRSVRLRAAGGAVEFAGAIGEFLGPVDWVAAFIATAGGELEREGSQAQGRGDPLTGLIYNAVGSERAEAAATVVSEELRFLVGGLGLAPTLPYSPGYCGMALDEQRSLFALFGNETAGVSLTPSLLMQPIKSISGLIGIGPAAEVQQRGSPCDRCELWTCQMRRGSPQ